MVFTARFLVTACCGSFLALFACSSDDSSDGSSNASGGSGGTDNAGGSGGGGGSDVSTSGGSGGMSAGGAAGADGSNSGGTSSSGGNTSSTATSASGGTGGGDLCSACEAACLPSGECVDCIDNSDCTGSAAVCDSVSNTCVECTASEDTCAVGFCSEANECVAGCNDDSMCASGSCGQDNDCDSCLNDDECSGDRVCGSGTCDAACTEEGSQCGSGGTCCSSHCVNTEADINHCGDCGVACMANEFCTTDATVECAEAIIANLCRHETVTLVGDGASIDDAAAGVIRDALTDTSTCDPAPNSRSLSQETADVINNMTGQPLVGPGQLLIASGGGFFNNLSGYVAETRIAPVYDRFANDNYYFTLSSNDTDVAEIAASSLSAGHDLIAIQLARDPLTGTLVLNAYGLDATGTTAAAWYFANVMALDLASYTDAWYVYEWTDDAADGASDASEFALQGSGT